MRQHPKVMQMVVAAAACLLGSSVVFAQTSANVARVSYVQGSVQLLAGQGADFQQAVMNMPVVDGSRLQTGADGQAEVEFGDGSVARVTPNSSLRFNHLGQDQVQLEQLAGLGYYEFNVGEGHPPFTLQFSNLSLQPTANSVLRVGLDAGWEVAVVSGGANLQGTGSDPVTIGENESLRSGTDTVAQGFNPDSWDSWNQDRDQAIAEEASQQTPVREAAANPQNENWNDLDASGNWYPVEGSGNVWVPSGVDADWDPYGAGYWADYPTLGYTWVSAYPWGWLPYHCGAWGYYSFGWGWAPGGCGRVWSPVIVVRSHPPGWQMPIHPPGGIRPLPGQRLMAVDRGPVAKGPWAFGNAPRAEHERALNFNGHIVAPVAPVDVHAGLVSARGIAPGSRAVMNAGGGSVAAPRSGPNGFYGANPPRAYENPTRPSVGYTAPRVQQPSYNQRSTYVARPAAEPHYSAPPPQPHYQAPPAPAPHYSAPPAPAGPRR